MNKILMGVAVDALAFLELSGDDVVDPDAAVGLTESIAHELRNLGTGERLAFVEFIASRAELATSKGDQRLAAFMVQLPRWLALDHPGEAL